MVKVKGIADDKRARRYLKRFGAYTQLKSVEKLIYWFGIYDSSIKPRGSQNKHKGTMRKHKRRIAQASRRRNR